MKAQNYQIKGDNLIIYGLLVSLLLPVAELFLDDAGLDYMTGSLYAVSMFSMLPFVFLIISLIIVTRIIGWDMNDKTINYEMLSGHSRAQVFFGRLLVAFAWTIISSVIVAVIPLIFFTIINGWGYSLNVNDFVIRFAVMLCPYIRWICVIVFITVLAKNSNAGIVLGYMLVMGSLFPLMLIKEVLDINTGSIFAFPNLVALSEFSNSIPRLIGDEMVTVYDGTIDASLLKGSVIISLVVGAVYVLISYRIFKKRDM
ncbi:MAG: ABC transporter permease [Clostridium sp.]|nr:ABC transporter permease [Clostridium sp.]MCM1207920.1 ABC transporter permease [Ruminococcus sp.]